MDDNKMIGLETKCTRCDKTYHTRVKLDAYLKRMEKKGFVQDLFPDLTPAERELFFKTGICGACFDKMFGPPPGDP